MTTPELPLETDVESVATMRSEKTTFLLLDVREEMEFATASIHGSHLIPMSLLAERVEELEPYRDTLIVVHCHHGVRSLQVALALRQHGFAQVQSMSGGIDRWSLEIDPTVPRY